jgi:hypothetical protein
MKDREIEGSGTFCFSLGNLRVPEIAEKEQRVENSK